MSRYPVAPEELGGSSISISPEIPGRTGRTDWANRVTRSRTDDATTITL